jgi:hypothetical protein
VGSRPTSDHAGCLPHQQMRVPGSALSEFTRRCSAELFWFSGTFDATDCSAASMPPKGSASGLPRRGKSILHSSDAATSSNTRQRSRPLVFVPYLCLRRFDDCWMSQRHSSWRPMKLLICERCLLQVCEHQPPQASEAPPGVLCVDCSSDGVFRQRHCGDRRSHTHGPPLLLPLLPSA